MTTPNHDKMLLDMVQEIVYNYTIMLQECENNSVGFKIFIRVLVTALLKFVNEADHVMHGPGKYTILNLVCKYVGEMSKSYVDNPVFSQSSLEDLNRNSYIYSAFCPLSKDRLNKLFRNPN